MFGSPQRADKKDKSIEWSLGDKQPYNVCKYSFLYKIMKEYILQQIRKSEIFTTDFIQLILYN